MKVRWNWKWNIERDVEFHELGRITTITMWPSGVHPGGPIVHYFRYISWNGSFVHDFALPTQRRGRGTEVLERLPRNIKQSELMLYIWEHLKVFYRPINNPRRRRR